jgi:hypothetical protein
MHASAMEMTLKLYKFNGSRYLRAGCQNVILAIEDSEGDLQRLPKPKITPCQ